MKKGFYLLVAKSPGHLVDRVMPTGDQTFRMHQQLALCSARASRCNNPERKFIFEGKKWCPEPESNQRHADFQSAALPTELSGRALMWRGGYPSAESPVLIEARLFLVQHPGKVFSQLGKIPAGKLRITFQTQRKTKIFSHLRIVTGLGIRRPAFAKCCMNAGQLPL
jgi:hypothetical protein